MSTPEEQEQELLLDGAKQKVKEQAFFMRNALEGLNLREGLRSAFRMLMELGVRDKVQLNPKNYYILFMQVFDELRKLEQFFQDEYRRGRKMQVLYEEVQKAPKLIPRLYLLITAGSVYIKTRELGAKAILMDLLEMIKAVQHPTRGLFVRYYFLKMCKDKLPDTDSEYYGEGGDIDDCINVITRNLMETTKLWIRMSGKSKEKPKREKQRIELKLTVGENIHRLSSLVGVNAEIYQTTLLPKLLDLIITSKDVISQNYFIDCIISCFPDEYHIITLPQLLDVVSTQLQPQVDIRIIFISIMDRLADFAIRSQENESSFTPDNNIFSMFKNNIDKMVENSSKVEFKNVLDLMSAFLKFSLKCYSSNSSYVNSILESCVTICQKQDENDFNDECLSNIASFLTMPLDTMSISILTMNEYPKLMKYLPFIKRRQVAQKILKAVINLRTPLVDEQVVSQLLVFISPLLQTDKDYQEISLDDFQDEQHLVCRILHQVVHETPQEYLNLLQLFLDKFKLGELRRQKFTYPAMFFSLAKLARQVQETNSLTEELNYKSIFQIMKSLIETIQAQYHELAFKLYVQFILIINEFDPEKELDEFTFIVGSQAILIYEEDLNSSNSKVESLQIIIGALSKLSCLNEENFDTLTSNISKFSSKLLKKQDQIQSILNCAHLFFGELEQDIDSVNKCLKKSIKIAQTILNQNPNYIILFIYIINSYFIFWLKPEVTYLPTQLRCLSFLQFSDISVEEAQNLISIITQGLKALEKSAEATAIAKYWTNTLEFIQFKKKEEAVGFVDLNL